MKKIKRNLLIRFFLSPSPQNPPFTYFLDSPEVNLEITTTFVLIRGWITANSPIENVILISNNRSSRKIQSELRPDVEKAFPEAYVFGFRYYLYIPELNPEHKWSIQFILDQNTYSFAIPFTVSPTAMAQFWSIKNTKLKKLKNILRCPLCAGETFTDTKHALYCQNCQTNFPYNTQHYNFLTPDLLELAQLKPSTHIATTGYDQICLNLIEKYATGLILDNGCGAKDYYHFPNIINLEVVAYPSTDVLGIGENLPFKANIFDAIFSFAVLEHIRNPFAAAKEIIRVLKPGGTLYIQVPFLQPFHGYPDHYYNMTSSGLKNLFDQDLEIIESGVQEAGLPIWALTWFLNSYIQGLPPTIAEEFKNLKIADLLQPAPAYLKQNFVTQLNPKTNQELASVNYLIAKKIQ